ncbi:MlaA family lipoprotein [Thiorhodovibrio frisius]|uniref:Surface lipoprotein n=1 Tax=Thiorhodovibrio frisius TaxID=631362 RepID=H8Z0R1_9GAMM|nr:VacJ family lipoprotein [Thiorhodovibrio frisius]EIC22402.1 surface lipoprotein [Thiorhodovibrio frisius]WPL24701.1 putative phospholipid-binding lipoprotein MlaA precursor [Thiorhodovibrio frisius]
MKASEYRLIVTKPGALFAACLMVIFAAGCASVPPEYRDPRDPWQPYNRAMFKFNTDFDNAFIKPTAEAYQAITPEPVNRSVTNFFGNVADLTSAVNNLLQFKLSRTGSDISRVLVNTTVGVLGLFDVATNVGIPSYKEDFGQTLGYWGFANGPYFIMPIIGPSTVRDTFGFAGDVVIDPCFSVNRDEIYWGFIGLRVIDKRAGLLTAGEIFEEAAIDRYSFVRDAYLQKRDNDVHDGDPADDAIDDNVWDLGVVE